MDRWRIVLLGSGFLGSLLALISSSLILAIQVKINLYPSTTLNVVSGYLLPIIVFLNITTRLYELLFFSMAEVALFCFNLASGLSFTSTSLKGVYHLDGHLVNLQIAGIICFILSNILIAMYGLSHILVLFHPAFPQKTDLENEQKRYGSYIPEATYVTAIDKQAFEIDRTDQERFPSDQTVIKKSSEKTLVNDVVSNVSSSETSEQSYKIFISKTGYSNSILENHFDGNWMYGSPIPITIVKKSASIDQENLRTGSIYKSSNTKCKPLNRRASKVKIKESKQALQPSEIEKRINVPKIRDLSLKKYVEKSDIQPVEIFQPKRIDAAFNMAHGEEALLPEFDVTRNGDFKSINHPIIPIIEESKPLDGEINYLKTVNESLLPPVLKDKFNIRGSNDSMDMLEEKNYWKLEEIDSSEDNLTIANNTFTQPRNNNFVQGAWDDKTTRESDSEVNMNTHKSTSMDSCAEERDAFRGFDQNIQVVSNSDRSPTRSKAECNSHKNQEGLGMIFTEQDNAYSEYMNAMSGLEDIPKVFNRKNSWITKTNGEALNHISLEDWEENKDEWYKSRIVSGKSNQLSRFTEVATQSANCKDSFELPDSTGDRVISGGSLYRSHSLPTLSSSKVDSLPQTYDGKNRVSLDYGVIPSTFKIPAEPSSLSSTLKSRGRDSISSTKSTLMSSPKRIGSIIKKSTTKSFNDMNSHRKHKYSNSVLSLQSSRSISPKKSFKSFFSRSPSKKNEDMSDNESRLSHQHLNYNEYQFAEFLETKSLFLEPVMSSDKSRVSSVPSAVIGEYDREKWRTLKEIVPHDS